MKRTLIIIALMSLLVWVHTAMATPAALIEEPVFEFEATPEGVHVDHEFVVKNTGDTVLHIDNVLPP